MPREEFHDKPYDGGTLSSWPNTLFVGIHKPDLFTCFLAGAEVRKVSTTAKRTDLDSRPRRFAWRLVFFGLIPAGNRLRSLMKIPGLRAADELVGGLAHFGRMLDKIRLQAAGTLPDGYFLGEEDFGWWDARCCRFLKVGYADVVALARDGIGDDAALAWCFENGRRPDEEEIQIWTAFILKRGWRDNSTAAMEENKAASGLGDRDDIVTWVELFKAEEA